MRIQFVDIQAQYRELKEQINQSVLQVLDGGNYIFGRYNQLLEKSIAELHQVQHAIAVNSGTDALRIMMEASGIGKGDEVITSSFTFVATVETILQLGAKPVFVDIDIDTFNLNPEKIEHSISSKTKAILPAHLFGQMVDMELFASIAKRNKLILLEDAAQAIRSTHRKKFAGHLSKAAALSFYITKNLGGAGDGGMILTNDSEVAELAKSLRVHGMSKQRYYYDNVGYTSRLSEIQAAILYHKLSKLQSWHKRKNQISNLYYELLNHSLIKLPLVKQDVEHTWHQFTILVESRDEVQKMLSERGIPTMIYYPIPIHMHSPYAKYAFKNTYLPITEQVSQKVLSIPIHPHLTDNEIYFIAKNVNECVKKVALSNKNLISV